MDTKISSCRSTAPVTEQTTEYICFTANCFHFYIHNIYKHTHIGRKYPSFYQIVVELSNGSSYKIYWTAFFRAKKWATTNTYPSTSTYMPQDFVGICRNRCCCDEHPHAIFSSTKATGPQLLSTNKAVWNPFPELFMSWQTKSCISFYSKHNNPVRPRQHNYHDI